MAICPVYTENYSLHAVARLNDVASFPDLLRPRHLRDVNQSFDSGLEFHEGSKVHHTRDDTTHTVADFVLARHGLPRMRLELLRAERNAVLPRIDLDDLG